MPLTMQSNNAIRSCKGENLLFSNGGIDRREMSTGKTKNDIHEMHHLKNGGRGS